MFVQFQLKCGSALLQLWSSGESNGSREGAREARVVSYNIATGVINGILDTWVECSPIELGGLGAGGGGGDLKPEPKPKNLSKVSCSAAVLSTALSATTDLLWLTGIGEAATAAKAGARLFAAGNAATAIYAERFAVKEIAGTSQTYYGSRIAGKQATTLVRDEGLSVFSGGGGSAMDFLSGLVPVYGTYKAFQTYKSACGVGGGGR